MTEPTKGALRAIATAEGITALDIPANVGGRFSVLTPVGVFPAALIGIDATQLLAGAASMRDACASPELTENIGGVGPTPLGALGATDQHSKVQLFMEGPGDTTVTFIGVDDGGVDVESPKLHGDIPELAYLGGHRLSELLDIERRATAGALARRGRPNMTRKLERVDAWHVGGLLMLLEMATAFAGQLYGVDAFMRPGMELAKQFPDAMLGRADADQARQEWDLLPTSDPSRVL